VNSVSADLILAMFSSPSPLTFGQDLTYTLLIANLGPATATGVTVTNTLPPGVSFVSASPPAYVVTGSLVAFTNLGTLGSGWGTNAFIIVHPNVGGTLTNTATCGSGVTDPLKGNNTVTVKTLVEGSAPQLSITISGGSLVISWPTSAVGFNLESTTNLNPPVVWTPVSSPAPVIVGDRYVVTLPIGGGNKFFRLRAVGAKSPRLSTSRAGNNLVIAWPADAAGYALERTSSLMNPVSWTEVTVPSPVTVGDQKTVTLPIGGDSEFFRLRAPSP